MLMFSFFLLKDEYPCHLKHALEVIGMNGFIHRLCVI